MQKASQQKSRAYQQQARERHLRYHQRRAKEPVIEVQDANGQPIKGAAVSFVLPDLGASGVFSNGASSLALLTDEKGIAVGRGLRPNDVVGQFEAQSVHDDWLPSGSRFTRQRFEEVWGRIAAVMVSDGSA